VPAQVIVTKSPVIDGTNVTPANSIRAVAVPPVQLYLNITVSPADTESVPAPLLPVVAAAPIVVCRPSVVSFFLT
jgi:hypothetical protein